MEYSYGRQVHLSEDILSRMGKDPQWVLDYEKSVHTGQDGLIDPVGLTGPVATTSGVYTTQQQCLPREKINEVASVQERYVMSNGASPYACQAPQHYKHSRQYTSGP